MWRGFSRAEPVALAISPVHNTRMPLHLRTYHELTGADRSGLPEQIAAQRRHVAKRLAAVRRLVAVMSGKGGVGKSYVTAHLARALARSGRVVGVLDADLNGPTMPSLLGIEASRIPHPAEGVEPLQNAEGVRCMSMALLLEDGRPLAFRGPESESFVWRGALETAALREFLGDVAWGPLDVLLVDLPPGIDRYLELADIVPDPPPVLTVTIPTLESRDAVRRAMRAARDRGSELLGVIENMVGDQFPGSAGDELATEFRVPLLARLAFHPTDGAWDSITQRIGDLP